MMNNLDRAYVNNALAHFFRRQISPLKIASTLTLISFDYHGIPVHF